MSAVAASSCPRCHGDLPPGARFCAGCGARAGAPVSWNLAGRGAGLRTARVRIRRLVGVARARSGLVVALVVAYVEARRERLRIRLYSLALGRERGRCLRLLGEAVHDGREDDEQRAKTRLR